MNKQIGHNQPLLSRIVRSSILLVFALLGAGAFMAGSLHTSAATSSTMNFQARLMTAAGAIVPDGTYNVEFKIYNAVSSSGSSQGSCTGDSACKWTETRTGGDKVSVANGYLTVNLGSVTSLPAIDWNQELWLTMNIGGTGTPAWDGEMSPRLKLTAVPYAFRAGQLAKLDSGFTSVLDFVQPTADRSILVPNESGTLCIQGSTACGFAAGSGSSNYIQNQNASDQTANFRISGTGRAATALQAPLLDTAAAGTLSLGTTNATAIALDKATTVTGNLGQSGGTVSLAATGTAALTGTGALTLTGGAASTFSTTSGGITIQAFNTNVLTLNTSGAGTVSVGNTNSTTISIGRGSDIARTINIGNAGSSTTQTISMGSLNGGSNTTIQGGTGASAINLTTGSGGSINLTVTGSGNVNFNSGASIIAKSTTNNTTAFQVQNASGGYVLNVDTSSNVIGLAYLNVGTSGVSDATIDTAFAATLFIGTTNATAITVGSNTSNVSVSCGTTTCSFGANATDHTTTIGSTTGASPVTIQGGTGAINVGTNAVAHTVTVGTLTGAATTTIQGGTGGVNLGTGGVANTIQIGNITGAVSQTTNVGTNGTASSTSNVNIGSSVAGTTAITGPTTITNRTSGSTDTLIVSNSTSTGPIAKFRDNSTTVFNLADGGDALFKAVADSSTAFQVQATTSSLPHFTIDTSAKRVAVGSSTTDANAVLLILDSYNTTDPTGVAGAMYFNSTRNVMRCFQAELWVDCVKAARSSYYRSSDMMHNAGDADVDFFTDTGTVGEAAGLAGRPGIVRLLTASAANTFAITIGANGNDSSVLFGANDVWKYEASFQLLNLSTATQTYFARSGFLDQAESESADGCYFRYSDGINSGKWQGVCVESTGALSTCDTGTTVAATTWYRLTVVVTGTSTADFRINGTSACTVNTGIPESTGEETNFGTSINKTVGTTARELQIDYLEVNGELGAR